MEAAFDGGRVTSDGGLLLVREVEERLGVVRRFAECFQDHRDPSRVEHSVQDLLRQRVFGLICGYEDLNDHDALRDDAMLAVAVGKSDTTGQGRRRGRDHGHPLASASTLLRLEHARAKCAAGERYEKITIDPELVEHFFVEEFLRSYEEPPAQIVLDIDATDTPLHGKQEGRYFHGHYGEYIYLPLYIFCGEQLLAVKLQTADKGAAHLAVPELDRICAAIVDRWPNTEIIIRGDSGFANDELMSWCEESEIDFILGLARNPRLEKKVQGAMRKAMAAATTTGEAARRFTEFRYRTRASWSRERRVVGKAEYLVGGKKNPRFVVTSLPRERFDARRLYEELYCARGEAENHIKEQQLGLFADRMSSHTLGGNQLRLWISAVAYTLALALRRHGLRGTALENAEVATIRARLLKIGAKVKISARRVVVSLSSVFPLAGVFAATLANLQRLTPLPW